MGWQDICPDKVLSPQQAAKLVKSGDRVVIGGASRQPGFICQALAERKDELTNVTIVSMHSGPYPWLQPDWGEDSFQVETIITTIVSRQIDAEKKSEWVPQIWGMADGTRCLDRSRGAIVCDSDVCLFSITPPDKNGWCSFGENGVWYNSVGARTAKIAIGEVNPNLAWTCGEAIHISELSYLVDAGGPQPLYNYILPLPPETDVEPLSVIGVHVADLIRDGDTLEIGSGSPSEAVLEFLGDKNDLGIDTELMASMMLDLAHKGIFTSKRNNIHPGKHILTGCLIYDGDPRREELLGYLDRNPVFEYHDVSYICNVPRIASNDNFVAINTALSVDLTGQAIISHLGLTPLSGFGGQPEFCIGAHYSKRGRSISTLLSTFQGGTVSRIVPQFEAGATIGIPGYYIDYLVTEYGTVNLEGKSLRQRAEAIISIAHPDFRPELTKAAQKLFWP